MGPTGYWSPESLASRTKTSSHDREKLQVHRKGGSSKKERGNEQKIGRWANLGTAGKCGVRTDSRKE